MKKVLVIFFVHTLGFAIVDGAIVLSVYQNKYGVRKVLISEEHVEESPFFQTYEGWGGAFKADEDTNEFDTAAREFWEEALLEGTIGWDLKKTKEYLHSDAVESIVEVRNITKFFPTDGIIIPNPIFTFIVNFDLEIIKQIKQTFFAVQEPYNQNPTEENFKFREKGDLATLTWDSFVQTIAQAKPDVIAKVYKKDGSKVHKTIRLRSILVGALHNHFMQYPQPITDHQVYKYECTKQG